MSIDGRCHGVWSRHADRNAAGRLHAQLEAARCSIHTIDFLPRLRSLVVNGRVSAWRVWLQVCKSEPDTRTAFAEPLQASGVEVGDYARSARDLIPARLLRRRRPTELQAKAAPTTARSRQRVENFI
jgi:hypothetical protein